MLGAFDRDNWYEIWAVLRANKLRTVLTAFGVAWGIFMLIVMLGFGSAMQSGTKRNMKGMATNMLWVWGQTTTEAYDGMQLGGWMNGFVVTYGSKAGSFNVFGDYPDLKHIISFEYEAGRFLNDQDIAE